MENIERKLMRFYVSPMSKILGMIFLLLGVIGNTILFVILSNSDMNINEFTWNSAFTPPEGDSSGWSPYLIPWLACMILILTGIIMVISNRLKVAKFQSLLKHGDKVDAKVVSNIQNFRVQQQSYPRREVTFKTDDGNFYVYRFFGEELAKFFTENSIVKIVVGKSEKTIPDPDFIMQLMDSESEEKMNIES